MKKKRREFNWMTRLNQLVKRKTPLPDRELFKLRRKAMICAFGRPHDDDLTDLGYRFDDAIAEKRWKRALAIFHKIEKRTALLLKEAA